MTVVTLVPNTTAASDGDWSAVGAATLHAAVDAFDSGTTLIRGSFAQARFGLTTFTLPAGAVVASARVGHTHRLTSGGSASVTSELGLYDAFFSSWEILATVDNVAPASFTQYTSSYVLQANLDQATIDSLQILTYNAGSECDVGYVFANIKYVVKPVTVVNAVTPDPIATSGVAPISWTNTLDSDGGAQSRYWVRVFTQAQYSIGGFNPETSPATYDSGNLTGTATSRNTTALPGRGQVYRAYVRVGQTFSVGGGTTTLYSAWAFDQFTTGGSPVSLSAGTRAAVTITGGQRAVITLANGDVL